MSTNGQAASFLDKSRIKAGDMDHRRKINFNIGKYESVVPLGKQQFDNVTLARERAKNIKWRAIETLDQQLERFEQAFSSRGGKVIWAENAEEALQEMIHYYQAVKDVNGTLITIWHNSFLGTDSEFEGWKEVYQSFVETVDTLPS